MKKGSYDISADDEYVDIWVRYSLGQRDWEMHLYRDKETLAISAPMYRYSPNDQTEFKEVKRIPKRVQRYFDNAINKAKTLLILEDS